MKANEAPERLYCCDKGNGNLFVDYRPFPNDDNIEYIRKDTFTEKAAEWLEENLSEYCDGEDIEYTPSCTYNLTIL